MEPNYWVKFCADCWLCKYTRNCKKPSFLYHLARFAEKLCPWCWMANKITKKDMQKSSHF